VNNSTEKFTICLTESETLTQVKVDRFQPKAVIFEPEYKELGTLELVAVLHM